MQHEPDAGSLDSHVWKEIMRRQWHAMDTWLCRMTLIMQASSTSRTHHTHDLSHRKDTSDIVLPQEAKP